MELTHDHFTVIYKILSALEANMDRGGLNMKEFKYDENVLFDDNETAEDLLITDLSDEELDKEFKKLFPKIDDEALL